ncbi:ROK family transcriptional regulator [Arthrobacter sp. ov118]|uniref:ROK family transcriptional regulator n=1 Tax=Arthrobacter sp. ov118 TaxID=1761747 RepID=UPI0008E6A296|nr:ROK family transcriptional regulator [Arthrobacter sp. ov118]SFU11296.1 Sugar kinase of the NBD/HSP70 family, may contain an N-terminal HTH domain [Arthrobacter sp. ov118]
MRLPKLTESGKKTLAVLLALERVSRPQVSAETGLSKQTVSIAMEELASMGLVEVISSQQGPTGRSASVYGLGRLSGWILGVDFGSTHIRLAATSLSGHLIVERDIAVSGSPNTANADFGDDARRAVKSLIDELTSTRGDLLTVCVALSRAVPALCNWNGETRPDMPADLWEILAGLDVPTNVAFYAENNVNCAALGELRHGGSGASSDFAYLQVGVGIGAGIISNGHLVRGARGEAGELRYLPSPLSDPHFPNAETALNSAGLLERYNRACGPEALGKAESVQYVLNQATKGHQPAVRIRQEQVDGIAYLVAALVAIANPETIILGGGMGQNPTLLPSVREAAERLGLKVRIEPGSLKDAATVAGAAALARDLTLTALLGQPLAFPLLLQSAKWPGSASQH